MAALVYSAIASLDGYVNDAGGGFAWARPDDELHAFVNDQERSIGTYLYGRRMYETMSFWETVDDPEPVMRDYAELWRAAEKVVFSATLDGVRSERTRIERRFDPEAVRALVAGAEGDVSIGGATLAGAALRAGLVDEVCLIPVPAIVGGGTRALPDGLRVDLELLDERRFAGGAVYLRHAVRR